MVKGKQTNFINVWCGRIQNGMDLLKLNELEKELAR